MKSEGQYKNIDDRIKTAAKEVNYPFNESSWKKMESLLDKKEGKRRPLFWILPVTLISILLTGGFFYYKAQHNQNNQNVSYTPGQNDQNGMSTLKSTQKEDNQILSTKENNGPDFATNKSADKKNEQAPYSTAQQIVTDPMIITKKGPWINKVNNRNLSTGRKVSPTANKAKGRKGKINDGDDQNGFDKEIKQKFEKGKAKIKVTSPKLTEDEEPAVETETKPKEDFIKMTTSEKESDKLDESIKKAEQKRIPEKEEILDKKKPLAVNEKKDKHKKKITPAFYVMANGGLDLSTTRLFAFGSGKISPKYGVHIGYQLSPRFSIQTGFVANAKKYLAGPDDYKVKAGSYLSTVKIVEVDANCNVYEIPLTLQYNWSTKNKMSYFASVGLSSYIMKRETYNYTLEHNGYTYVYPYDYTGNKHFFAATTISVGIEKRIGKQLFLQAAPAITVPLGGVGEGSVKLFSTSLNLGLKYFPFKK